MKIKQLVVEGVDFRVQDRTVPEPANMVVVLEDGSLIVLDKGNLSVIGPDSEVRLDFRLAPPPRLEGHEQYMVEGR